MVEVGGCWIGESARDAILGNSFFGTVRSLVGHVRARCRVSPIDLA